MLGDRDDKRSKSNKDKSMSLNISCSLRDMAFDGDVGDNTEDVLFGKEGRGELELVLLLLLSKSNRDVKLDDMFSLSLFKAAIVSELVCHVDEDDTGSLRLSNWLTGGTSNSDVVVVGFVDLTLLSLDTGDISTSEDNCSLAGGGHVSALKLFTSTPGGGSNVISLVCKDGRRLGVTSGCSITPSACNSSSICLRVLKMSTERLKDGSIRRTGVERSLNMDMLRMDCLCSR